MARPALPLSAPLTFPQGYTAYPFDQAADTDHRCIYRTDKDAAWTDDGGESLPFCVIICSTSSVALGGKGQV